MNVDTLVEIVRHWAETPIPLSAAAHHQCESHRKILYVTGAWKTGFLTSVRKLFFARATENSMHHAVKKYFPKNVIVILDLQSDIPQKILIRYGFPPLVHNILFSPNDAMYYFSPYDIIYYNAPWTHLKIYTQPWLYIQAISSAWRYTRGYAFRAKIQHYVHAFA